MRLIFVENSPEFADLTERLLSEEFGDIEVARITTLTALKKRLAAEPWDIILSKSKMRRFDVFDILKWQNSTGSHVPLIVVSATASRREAVSLFRAGARDVIGGEELARLPLAIRRELEHAKKRDEQRKAETALAESEEQKRLILETVPDLVWVKNVEGVYIACNPMFERFFGATETEIVGKTDYDFVERDLAKFFRRHDKAAMDADRPLRNEEWITFADDGHEALLETTKTSLRNRDGKVIGVLGIGRDITERKRAEEALRVSEARFRAFMKVSPESLFLKDTDLRYLAVNPAFERRHGVRASDIIGKPVDEFHRGEVGKTARLHDIQVLSSGKTCYFVSDLFDANSARLVERVVKFPVEDADGNIVGMGGISIDITALKEAREAVERTNRALRTLSACNEVLVRAESEGDLLRDICNSIVEVGGYPFAWVGFAENDRERSIRPAAVSGAPDLDAWPYRPSWATGPQGRCPTAIAIRTGEMSVVRDGFKGKRFDTVRSFAETHGYKAAVALPLKIGPRVVGALTIYSDVDDIFDEEELRLLTELADDLSFGIGALREAAERGRAEEERRKLSRAVEQSPTIVIITDAGGAIEYVNPKFNEVTGYAPHEVVGKRPSLMKSGDTDDAEYAELWKTIAAGHKWRGVFHNRRKDGTDYWADTAISPVKAPDGTITHFIGIQEDISERRETEQRMKQMEKMESLGNLAGGIAHDFNNMLLPIQSLTSMTLRDLPEDSSAARRLRKVIEASQRAGDLVKRILAFSRSETGERKSEDVGRVVEDAVALLRSTIPSTVRIVERIASVGDVVMDSAQVQTVILNLASNASDAMRGRPGTLDVSLSRAELAEPLTTRNTIIEPGAYAKITVRDTGSGIPPEVVDRIFEPFFTTKAVGEGTGLGLAMVHGIVTKHGGAITVTSEIGVGTSFDIYLPLTEIAGGSAAAA